MPRLLMPDLRIELKPYDVAAVRDILPGHYQISRPTRSPIGISS
jgi:hypothetical protein